MKEIKEKLLSNIVNMDELSPVNSTFFEASRVAYHKTLDIDGNLDLDILNIFDDGVDGIYVEADLRVNGNIFNGTSFNLYVGGDLYVNSLSNNDDGLCIVVGGNLYVKHLLKLSNEIPLKVSGHVLASLVIDEGSPDFQYEIPNSIYIIENDYWLEIWEDIIVDNDDEDEENYDENVLKIITKKWEKYHAIWSKEYRIPEEVFEMILGEGFNQKVVETMNERTFEKVKNYIENFRENKPSEELIEHFEND